jgi:hypothetical protein
VLRVLLSYAAGAAGANPAGDIARPDTSGAAAPATDYGSWPIKELQRVLREHGQVCAIFMSCTSYLKGQLTGQALFLCIKNNAINAQSSVELSHVEPKRQQIAET